MLKNREEFYIDLIKSSDSLIEVCRKANIVPTTGNYNTLKKVINNNNIDVSHFKRICGGNTKKKNTSEYLAKGTNVSSFKLKNRLLAEGIKEHKCENPECGLSEWHGKPIPLELHHINGDNTDNRIENLQLLCPNCHAFTDNYGGKNQKLNKAKKEQEKKIKGLSEGEKKEIINCSLNNDSIKKIAEKTNHSERTIKKILNENNIKINKNNKIKKENDTKILSIIDSIKRTRSFSKTGKEFGVSDNAIRKLLGRRNYPTHIKELLSYIN
jgi:hypothetical protein